MQRRLYPVCALQILGFGLGSLPASFTCLEAETDVAAVGRGYLTELIWLNLSGLTYLGSKDY